MMTSSMSLKSQQPLARIRALPLSPRGKVHRPTIARAPFEAVAAVQKHHPRRTEKRTEAIEYKLLFASAFAVFLVTSVLERISPHHWLGRKDPRVATKSVIEEAREAATISVGYAFMG